MKTFQLVPGVTEYARFSEFAKEAALTDRDLILTKESIYQSVIEKLGLGCRILFRERFGKGEPTDRMVDAILEELEGKPFERVVAVGGGTIIDIAKVLAVARAGERTDDLYDRMDTLTKAHPLIIVPATCGTGSEVTNISIINRTARGVKMGLVSPAMFADQAVLIPELLNTLPYRVFATSSIDAAVHAVESYLSPNACPLSELFSEKALTLILTGWRRSAGGGDAWKQDAAAFLRASCYAGIAFGYAGCAAVHALSYALGGAHHVAHGEANHVMLEPVLRAYAEKQPHGKLSRLAALMAPVLDDPEEEALAAFYALVDRVLERKPMRAYGVTEAELPAYADSVLEAQQRLLRNNYVPLSREEILQIYRNAF